MALMFKVLTSYVVTPVATESVPSVELPQFDRFIQLTEQNLFLTPSRIYIPSW